MAKTSDHKAVLNQPTTGHYVVDETRYFLKYIVKGRVSYVIDGRKFDLGEGQHVSLVLAGGQHYHVNADHEACELQIELCLNFLKCFFNGSKTDKGSNMRADEYMQPGNFFECVYHSETTPVGKKLSLFAKEMRDGRYGTPHENERLDDLAKAIGKAEHLNFMRMHALDSIRLNTKKETLRKLYSAKEFIDRNFNKKINAEKLARMCCMSKFSFQHAFRQVFFVSPHRYLLTRRIENTMELLKGGDKSITDIALEAGYPDVHSFSKAFKKHFGSSPSTFLLHP